MVAAAEGSEAACAYILLGYLTVPFVFDQIHTASQVVFYCLRCNPPAVFTSLYKNAYHRPKSLNAPL